MGGTVDFTFGWSTAIFSRCHIHSKRDGYVAAPSTDRGQKYGYVSYDCKLIAGAEVTEVYLSHPWYSLARAVSMHCDLGKHIFPAGQHNWDEKEAEKTAFYAKYDSYGPETSPKAHATFSHQLKDSKGYEVESMLSGSGNWDLVAGGNVLISTER